VKKKPPELPNIEDATIRACLVPLMDAVNAGGETLRDIPFSDPVARVSRPQGAPAGSPAGPNDDPLPGPETIRPVDRDYSGTPRTLAQWRVQGDDEFGAFRMIELFLAMTDVELQTAAAEFPRQISGTVARIARIKRRLAAQYNTLTAVMALLERAMARAAADARDD
jgi:hypothetical protein